MTRKQAGRLRTGFTLIEMLVVIAIIAVLASLIAAAVFRALLIMPVKNTQETILKLKTMLDQQWRAEYDAAWNAPIPPQVHQALLAQAGGDQNTARELWVKQVLQTQFPKSFQEINNPATGQPVASYIQAIQGQPVPPQYQSSVCLYLALEITRGVESGLETMGPNEVRVVPGTNLKCFIDAWGEPLSFNNGLPTPNPSDTPQAVIASGGPDKQPGNVDDISSDKLKMGDY